MNGWRTKVFKTRESQSPTQTMQLWRLLSRSFWSVQVLSEGGDVLLSLFSCWPSLSVMGLKCSSGLWFDEWFPVCFCSRWFQIQLILSIYCQNEACCIVPFPHLNPVYCSAADSLFPFVSPPSLPDSHIIHFSVVVWSSLIVRVSIGSHSLGRSRGKWVFRAAVTSSGERTGNNNHNSRNVLYESGRSTPAFWLRGSHLGSSLPAAATYISKTDRIYHWKTTDGRMFQERGTFPLQSNRSDRFVMK